MIREFIRTCCVAILIATALMILTAPARANPADAAEFARGVAYAEMRLADGARPSSLRYDAAPLDFSAFDAGVASVLARLRTWP